MKFLVDESTGIAVSKKLKQMGFDSASVIDCKKGAEEPFDPMMPLGLF
jgi:uncharacterized protein (DUF302 family)